MAHTTQRVVGGIYSNATELASEPETAVGQVQVWTRFTQNERGG